MLQLLSLQQWRRVKGVSLLISKGESEGWQAIVLLTWIAWIQQWICSSFRFLPAWRVRVRIGLKGWVFDPWMRHPLLGRHHYLRIWLSRLTSRSIVIPAAASVSGASNSPEALREASRFRIVDRWRYWLHEYWLRRLSSLKDIELVDGMAGEIPLDAERWMKVDEMRAVLYFAVENCEYSC